MAWLLQRSRQRFIEGAKQMATKCEVFGWLLVDDAARVLVREESGHISLQSAKPESAPGHWAIQTGSFRRGKPIVDPVTGQSLGYEMEWVASPLAAAVP
jgi:hypothetical protein